jgi:hypothetical protein
MNDSYPGTITVDLLSDSTFSRGEPTAGEVDVEVEHDELGLPFLGGKALHGLLRDTWLSLAPYFPHLLPAAQRLLGRPAALRDAATLRVGDATLDEPLAVAGTLASANAVRAWVAHAESRERHPIAPGEVLRALTDIRWQTAEERATGAPAHATLRSSRVVLRGHRLTAPLTWERPPTTDELRCLALSVLGTRHAGLGRNRGRGHVRLSLDGDVAGTRALVREAAL